MTGSLAEAEDVVQDAWLRWNGTDQRAIDNPAAWLTTVTTRLSLDRLKAMDRRRADYVGEWLPEPVAIGRGPEETAEVADSLTLGFLVLLDRLTPLERAVFLLAEVFSEPYRDIGATVGRSPEACRQIASRARHKLDAARRPALGVDQWPRRGGHRRRGAARPAGHRGAGRRRRPRWSSCWIPRWCWCPTPGRPGGRRAGRWWGPTGSAGCWSTWAPACNPPRPLR